MTLVLSDITAARLWAAYGSPGFPAAAFASPTEAKRALASAPTKRDIDRLLAHDLPHLAEPIDALVVGAHARRAIGGISCGSLFKDPPPRSICRFEESLYITSPALTYIRLGLQFEIPQLAFIGSLLCGTFAISPNHDGHRNPNASTSLPERTPITTRARISDYVENASGIHGASLARSALRYIGERARSPMEIELFLLMTLPPRFGGYGLEPPLMNTPIHLGRGDVCIPDFHWAGHHVVMEYLGEQYHSDPDQMRASARRANVYADHGFAQIVVTFDQIKSGEALDRIVRPVFSSTGKRMRLPREFHERQAHLISQINKVRRLFSF